MEVKEDYEDMRDCGYQLGGEICPVNMVSLTIFNADEDADASLVGNGPEIQAALVRMLKNRKWRQK